MQFHIRTEKDKVTLLADVPKIEVEDVVGDNSLDESYSRTIRFTCHNGQAIEVVCDAFEEKDLWIERVRELKPVEKPEQIDWLEPKVYKGSSNGEIK